MKKPRNKRYVPKPVSLNPLSEVFGGLSGDHADHLRVLNIRNHAAMAALTTGTGGREEWDLLVGAINIANVMCEQGIGDEFRAATIAGRDALMAVGKRGATTGRFLFRGDELAAMNHALACHDAQLENVRAIDVDRASNEVMRRIRHNINSTNVRAELARDAAQQ
ncbi:hypothetical protein CR152_27690 [Massilia violaceinigra]|uniref:Uncharacterized protein n=1 Tax=Massilia violaceinigra TaxID=2045208 RepID=A0A2D2DSA8_9BURK|nr:hypothetical protein [Massilia violaceinigra]ATQ77863.1 hypothetical protein CR152_27690 [Massilia violaceinigra]